jgi:hypothetical protein
VAKEHVYSNNKHGNGKPPFIDDFPRYKNTVQGLSSNPCLIIG